MSSLWTPEGEHRVTPDEASPQPDKAAPQPPSTSSAPSANSGGQDAELREDLAAMERELLQAPAEDVIANHCYGLFQLSALYLGIQPPRLDDARLAIDGLATIVESLGDRLGESAIALREGLAQIRLAYVQIAAAQTNANGSTSQDPPTES